MVPLLAMLNHVRQVRYNSGWLSSQPVHLAMGEAGFRAYCPLYGGMFND